MDPSTVSQILSGKRKCSQKIVAKVFERLSISPGLRNSILLGEEAISDIHGGLPSYQQLTADAFAVIADWYHYALLELTFVKSFQSSPRWIAKTLGISPAEASMAIERMVRLGLLEKRHGKLCKTAAFLSNGPDGFTAPALRELQRQLLQKALHAIDHVPIEEKDITSMTMAIDPAKLPEARKRIRNFRRELCAFLEQGPRLRVYNLGLQLYPVSEAAASAMRGKS
jgi:uncharacterized protein (TIGR02147 family)